MESKCKKCRRENEKLFLKGERCYAQKCSLTKKPYVPGMHGVKNSSRSSDYGNQLRAKQKIRRYYEIDESKMRNYYESASKNKGNTLESIWELLESRLDSTLRKILKNSSVSSARQLITHGKIKLNGKKCNTPSLNLMVGDTINLNNKLIETIDLKNIPNWITYSTKEKLLKIQSKPEIKADEISFQMKLLIEYYTK